MESSAVVVVIVIGGGIGVCTTYLTAECQDHIIVSLPLCSCDCVHNTYFCAILVLRGVGRKNDICEGESRRS
jgi:hypothetical protein